jgi:hypothetical protein
LPPNAWSFDFNLLIASSSPSNVGFRGRSRLTLGLVRSHVRLSRPRSHPRLRLAQYLGRFTFTAGLNTIRPVHPASRELERLVDRVRLDAPPLQLPTMLQRGLAALLGLRLSGLPLALGCPRREEWARAHLAA